jgi:parallel beta-helix repeat protein
LKSRGCFCGYVALSLLLFSGVSAHATNYFVATSGNDGNDGLSESTPWGPSLSNAVNRIHGGDHLFVRGGEYRGEIHITNSYGIAGNYVQIQAYTNEVPVLKGSRIVTGWVTSSMANVWMRTNWPYNSQQVFVNSNCLQQVGWPTEHNQAYGFITNWVWDCANWIYIPYGYDCTDIDPVTHTINIGNAITNMTANTFYYDGANQVLYVWLKDGSAPTNKTVEVSVDYAIFFDDSTSGYVRVSGLSFQHCNTTAWQLMGVGVKIGWKGIIENCSIEWCDNGGLTMYANAQAVSCRLCNNGQMGFQSGGNTNLLLSGCLLTNNNYRYFAAGNACGIAGAMKIIDVVNYLDGHFMPAGATIENCEFAGNVGCGVWFDTCTGGAPIIVRNNYIHDNAMSNRPGEANCPFGIFIENSCGAQVYNNVVVSNSNCGILIGRSWGCKVYNNLITATYDAPQGSGAALAIQPAGTQPTYGNRVFNNLVVNNRCLMDFLSVTNGYQVWTDGGVSFTNYNYDNYYDFNCFYRFGQAVVLYASSMPYSDLTTWTAATTWDSHSITSNPSLVGCRLSASSPCIDQGTNVGVVVTTDYDGVPRPLDGNNDGVASFDIGAFEFASPSSDTDKDGLSDADEVNTVQTDPTIGDCDGDSQLDGEEFIAGTDPWDSGKYFSMNGDPSGSSATGFVVAWQSATGRLYTVSSCTNVPVPAWTNLPDAASLEGTGARMSVTNSMSNAALKYYRVGVKRE